MDDYEILLENVFWNAYSLNLRSIYEYTYLIVYWFIWCPGHIY
jgi:hypothetical protein